MAVEKNIREVETTEADFVANAELKNDGFLTDDSGLPMIKRYGTDYLFWYPEKKRDSLSVYTYFSKIVESLTATDSVSIGDKIKDVDDSDLNIEFDSGNEKIIFNVGGSPIFTIESDGVTFGTNWKLHWDTGYWALYNSGTYSGFGVGDDIPETI